MEIYFDNAATTSVYREVTELMVRLMKKDYGNPSSLHMKGIAAENYIKEAKTELAGLLKCKEKEIIFTSGGTESNNMALIGAAMAKRRAGKHIITTKVEHASVLSTVEFLGKEGFDISYVGVDTLGKVDMEELRALLREDTILVSVMHVNNETGAVQPIAEISRLIKEYNKDILFHVDGVQAFGKYEISPKQLGVDLFSISGHKIHGPKGSGMLYVKDGVLIRPIIYGGGQQKGMRSGTENVPAIAGFGLAAGLAYKNFEEKIGHLRALKDCFINKVTKLENVFSNSGEAPHIASISIVGIRAEVFLHALEEKGIYVSAGSACASNKPHVSNVLLAMELPKEYLESTLRFSFSEFNTMEEVDYAVQVVEELLGTLRRYVRK
ncbi:MAG: cysteine desulfurase [Clostridium sp.]|nr:cysteine desulfurase [Clostridium sp.]